MRITTFSAEDILQVFWIFYGEAEKEKWSDFREESIINQACIFPGLLKKPSLTLPLCSDLYFILRSKRLLKGENSEWFIRIFSLIDWSGWRVHGGQSCIFLGSCALFHLLTSVFSNLLWWSFRFLLTLYMIYCIFPLRTKMETVLGFMWITNRLILGFGLMVRQTCSLRMSLLS